MFRYFTINKNRRLTLSGIFTEMDIFGTGFFTNFIACFLPCYKQWEMVLLPAKLYWHCRKNRTVLINSRGR